MITRFNLYYRAAFVAILLVLLCGCQQFNGMVAKITNRNRQMAYKPPTTMPDEPIKPLTAEQKADVQIAVARSLENQGDVEPAIKAYLDVVKKNPSRADAYHRLAVLHDSKGDAEASRKFYELAIKKDSKNPDVHCDFGYSCYLQRNWSEGESHLRHAIALDATCSRAHTNLGLLLARTRREKEALVEFYKAGCDEAAARANLGFALTLEEHWTEAQKQFELALVADPNSKMARDGLAAIRWRNGESRSQDTPSSDKSPSQTAATQPVPKITTKDAIAKSSVRAPTPTMRGQESTQAMLAIPATYETAPDLKSTQSNYRFR